MASVSERLVLCVNAGSTSLKLALVRSDGVATERIAESRLEREAMLDLAGAVARLGAGHPPPDVVAHRLVHGGPSRYLPTRVTSAVLDDLRRATRFAREHLPAELAAIDAITAALPAVPQMVCFDTAFHRSLPEIARRLPLPDEVYDAGLRRYGFHGLSCEHVVHALGPRGRLVVAHLGGGSSVTAVRDGRSLDTTMGLSPIGGVVMGTRSGDLDPGVLLELLADGCEPSELRRMLGEQSGLKAVSGGTSDMRALLAAHDVSPRARLAVEMYAASVRKAIAAMTAVLGGIDGLVFTGGIGERAAPVRALIASGLAHLGIVVDPRRNEQHDARIDGAPGSCPVHVVTADEEAVLARHAVDLGLG